MPERGRNLSSIQVVGEPVLTEIRASLDAHCLRVGPNYLSREGDVYMTSVDEYFSRQEWFKSRRLACPEFPVEDPDELVAAALFAASGATGPDAVLMLHAGYAGSASPIHFDWDFRRVLHLNLTGSKRLAVGHPDLGVRSPILINSLPYDLTRLSRAEQRGLFGWLGADIHRLGPGDGVIFPPLWWHAACYDRASLSLSFRFDEVVGLRPIAALPRSGDLQRVAWLLMSSTDDPARTIAIDEIVSDFFQPARSWGVRYRRFMARLQEIDAMLRSSRGEQPAKSVIPEHLNAERHVVRSELEAAYRWDDAIEGGPDLKDADRVARYLFEGNQTSSLTKVQRTQLARYAMVKRQGLPPARGLVLRESVNRALSSANA